MRSQLRNMSHVSTIASLLVLLVVVAYPTHLVEAFMVSSLSRHQCQSLHTLKVFNFGDNYLEKETERMFVQYDADDSGSIDKNEFRAVVKEIKQSSRREFFSVTSAALGGILAATASNKLISNDKIQNLEVSAVSSVLGMPEAKGQMITEDEVRQLFQLWNDALLTGDSDAVARRYAKNAVLLPTVSDIPRTTYAGIKDYFDNFLKLKPEGKIIESYVSVGENYCKDVGIYEFKKGTDGSVVRARYSFVYVPEDGEWKISHHHSSLMPEKLLADANANKA